LAILDGGLGTIPVSRVYTVEFTATAGTTEKITETTSFSLTVKNPCFDPTFVNIVASVEPADFAYTVYSTSIPIYYQLEIIATPSRIKPLCGLISFKFLYDDVEVVDDSTPISITDDESDNTIYIFSEDPDLIGTTATLTIVATMADYPSLDLSTETEITF
jgi:hypothetical protein